LNLFAASVIVIFVYTAAKISKNATEAIEITEGESHKTDPPSPFGQDIFELSLTPDQHLLEEENAPVPRPITEKTLVDLSPERMRGAPVDQFSSLLPSVQSVYLNSPVCEPEIVGVSIKSPETSSKSPQVSVDKPASVIPSAVSVSVDMDISAATPLQRVSQKSPTTQRMEEIKEDSQEYAIFGSPTPSAPDTAPRAKLTGLSTSASLMAGVEGEDESVSRSLVILDSSRAGESDAAKPIPSPLSLSGFRNVEKAICENSAVVAVKRLCNTTNTYLEDKSPICSQSQDTSLQKGAILVPLLGKLVDLKRKSTSTHMSKVDPLPPLEPLITKMVSPTTRDPMTTAHPVSPAHATESLPKTASLRKKRQTARGTGRRFFASSFAERCRRDEIRFLQVCKTTKPNATSNETRPAVDARKPSRRSGKRTELDETTLSQLCKLHLGLSPVNRRLHDTFAKSI
uniref:Pecanex-like protein n=1 Tax=Schistocephalus solidus TaxID=70667 RepID=A0A183TR65_SCHSO